MTGPLAAESNGVDHQVIKLWSEGVRLEGDIYRPAGLKAGTKLPGILMVHGWGGLKGHLNRNYAPQFAELGFIVLTFDYKGWGKSNGPLMISEILPEIEESAEVTVKATHIRKIVNPLSMVEDARAALNYLAGDPQVMSNNIGIWGSSLGGGIALVTAANNAGRINAYVDQIGAVNFKANLDMITDKMVLRWEKQRSRGKISPYPGAESAIIPGLKGYPDWIYMKRYDSLAFVDKLDAPTLIIDAEDEELFAREKNGKVLHAAIKDRLETKYLSYPGKHYDMYRGDNYENALRDAQQWFVKHLKDSNEGAGLYKDHCAACHSNPQTQSPAFSVLKAMSRDKILYAMNEGKMVSQAEKLSAEERATIAAYLTTDSKDPHAWESTQACSDGMKVNPTMKAAISGWGYGSENRRYQPQQLAGLSSADLGNLDVAWAVGFPGATELRSQPVITEDTLFVGVPSLSSVYAFDLESGCLKWTYRGNAPVRSALSFAHMPGTNTPILFYGDGGGSVHVISAVDGSKLWSVAMDMQYASITGTPVLHEERLYVPISTFEVAAAGRAGYECCQAHGGVRALNIRDGKTIWTYETTEVAQKQGKSSVGTQLWGPSGAPVWTTPAIDVKRNRLYIGTGENYSTPANGTSDAIIALDLDTGKPAWIYQALADDAYNMACVSYLGYTDGPNCPENSGPDFDFGASVIMTTDSNGRDILLAGQKSGDVYGLDPDNNGKVIWNTKLSDGTTVGGVHWGMTVVGDRVFVPIADPEWPIKSWEYSPRSGVAALDVSSGKQVWRHRASRDCHLDPSSVDLTNGRHKEWWPKCHFLYGFSGAATGMDGAILAGSLNGKLNAFATEDGSLLWQFDTKKPFDTLNGVKAHGGSLDNAGPAVAHGRMVIQSGYSYINQMPGNVLLVLKVKEP